MRDFVYPDFVAYLTMAGLIVALLMTIYSNRIAEWLFERDLRKKAEAKAKAAAESAAKTSAAKDEAAPKSA